MKAIAKYLATGGMVFLSLVLFIQAVYLFSLTFVFDEETHIPHVPISILYVVLSSIFLAVSVYLGKLWRIVFWHRLTLRSVLVAVVSISILLVLILRPAEIISKEFDQDGLGVEYAFSEPGLGRKTETWSIYRTIDRPIDELDEVARHQVNVIYYWCNHDTVLVESLAITAAFFCSIYGPEIPWLIASKKAR